MSDGWDELEQRARTSAESGGTPAEWGLRIDLEVGETFRGRDRGGWVEGGKSGAYLLWDLDGVERFIWSCASLAREYDRELPSLGADVVISRSENYRTKYDDEDGEPTGLSYGVATRANDSPLPGAEDGQDVEPLPF
jgi:hypothetical protein